jgi:hypothetical protein
MAERIRVHIEELVLHGFEPGDRRRIADALQAHLAELLSEAPLSEERTAGITLERWDAGTIRIREGSVPAVVGEQLAAALHGGMGRWVAR